MPQLSDSSCAESASSERFPFPASGFEAAWRGVLGRCPRCAGAKLFWRYLKPVAQCPHCRQDWTHQRADDFPAYLAILITGHVLAPIVIALIAETQLPLWGLTIIILSLSILLLGLLLQPAKGAVIAVQWWLGMHGFERPPRDAGSRGGAVDQRGASDG